MKIESGSRWYIKFREYRRERKRAREGVRDGEERGMGERGREVESEGSEVAGNKAPHQSAK